MRKVLADFSAPRHPSKRAWAALALLTACTAAVWAVFAAQELEIRRAQTEVRRLQAVSAEAARQRLHPAPQAPAPWDASARAMLAQAGTRWPAVLTSLESVDREGVLPVALSINVPAQTATVELQFNDYAGLLEYVEKLNAADAKLRWRLVQAHADARGGAPAGGTSAPSRATISAALPN